VTRVAIRHDRRIDHLTDVGEHLAQIIRSRVPAQATDEQPAWWPRATVIPRVVDRAILVHALDLLRERCGLDLVGRRDLHAPAALGPALTRALLLVLLLS